MSQAKKISKPKRSRIEELVVAAVEQKVEEVGRKLIQEGRRGHHNWTKLTMKRLYSYPLLKKNIERYRLDIEDIKKEDMGKSKSIVMFYTHSGGGEKPDLEELREAKIRMVEMKIDRDEKEISEIDAALDAVKDDPYYRIIELKFFQKLSHEEIAANMPCGLNTVTRHLGRLMDIMNVTLYGADALA